MSGRVATSLVMSALFTVFVAQALFFRREAAIMPMLIGLPGLVLSFAQLIIDIRKAGAAEEGPIFSERERMIMLWLTGFVLGVIAFGFVIGAPLLVAAYLLFPAGERLLPAVMGGGLCLAGMYGLERLLNIPVFEGLVIQYLF